MFRTKPARQTTDDMIAIHFLSKSLQDKKYPQQVITSFMRSQNVCVRVTPDAATLLHISIERGDIDTSKLLIELAAPIVNSRCTDGATPFYTAISKLSCLAESNLEKRECYSEIIKLLLQSKADIELPMTYKIEGVQSLEQSTRKRAIDLINQKTKGDSAISTVEITPLECAYILTGNKKIEQLVEKLLKDTELSPIATFKK